MSNPAQQPIFLEEVKSKSIIELQAVEKEPVAEKSSEKIKARRAKRHGLSKEDIELVAALDTVKREMECLHNRYDQVTDPLLLDSIIYELKAAHIKYKYFLKCCKDKGIIAN